MGLRRSPHLAAVVVDMATLAVADRTVAMTPTAASREAGDHSPSDVRATVLQSRETGERTRKGEERRQWRKRMRYHFIIILGSGQQNNFLQSQQIRR